MSMFELYMLANGWDGLQIVVLIGGIIYLIYSAWKLARNQEDNIKNSKIFKACIVMALILIVITPLIPTCHDMIEIYSAKYGSQEIQKQLDVFRGVK